MRKIIGISMAVLMLSLSGIVTIAEEPLQENNIITIDSKHKYEGMKRSFSKGYEPEIKKNNMRLIIPFQTKETLDDKKISVRIIFEQPEGPFVYRNYFKEVKENEKGIYLYDCNIKLRKERRNGQYPLKVIVYGRGSKGKHFSYEYEIYVEIKDGLPEKIVTVPSVDKEPERSSGGENIQDNLTDPANYDSKDIRSDSNQENTEMGTTESPSSEGQETEKVSYQPKVLMNSCNLNGYSLEAGQTYVFKTSFQNYSSQYPMKNVKIKLAAESPDIIFEKNNWYYETISPGQTIELLQNITIENKAANGKIPVEFQFEYDDEKGNSISAAEKCSLNVTQKAQASMKSSTFPIKAESTKTVKLNLQIDNFGLAPVYNVRVAVKGKGLFAVNELFQGTLEPGESMEKELSVYVGMKNMDESGKTTEEEPYGKTEGTITFTYEDQNGNQFEEIKEISTTIVNSRNQEKTEKKTEKKSNQWIIAVYMGCLVLLLLLLFSLFIRMRYYKKQIFQMK